jgi:hypothetical protein
MIARCYFDYVRVFVPAGSKLVTAKGVDGESISSRRGERGTQEFAGFFILPPAGQQHVSFRYRLPLGITPEGYRLLLQRQAGTQPMPLVLSVNGSMQSLTVTEAWLDWAAKQP